MKITNSNPLNLHLSSLFNFGRSFFLQSFYEKRGGMPKTGSSFQDLFDLNQAFGSLGELESYLQEECP